MLRYLGGVYDTCIAGGPYSCALGVLWALQPTAFVAVIHPSDTVGFQLWLQGFVVPKYMSHQALNAGEGVAIVAFLALLLLQLGVVTLIYRRANDYVKVWPLALFLIGFVANSIWWLKTGYFDPEGAM